MNAVKVTSDTITWVVALLITKELENKSVIIATEGQNPMSMIVKFHSKTLLDDFCIFLDKYAVPHELLNI